MVVYADILILVNTIVDYFILRTAQHFLHYTIKVWRIIVASLIGGISSLYIFLPESSVAFELLYKSLVCCVLSVILCGVKNLKKTLFCATLIFIVTCGYMGIIIALWFIFKPNGLLINNSIVYFDISPIILIVFTAVFYLVFSVFNYIFKTDSKLSERCNLKIFAMENCVELTAIVDSGNSIEDYLSNSEIIITDEKQIGAVFGDNYQKNEQLKSRFRKIPCGTVTGKDLLDAYRCDYAIVQSKNKKVRLEKPILAISHINFNDDYSAIVNPRIFL